MAQCLSPFYVKKWQYIHYMKQVMEIKVPVACGKCPECVARRVSGWSFRLMQEDKVSETAFFVTLTYDTKHVPLTRNGFMTLNKRDCQLFFKRLRKAVSKVRPDLSIKYYLAGEYGGRTSRPHYHVILFNAPDTKFVEEAWGLGAIHYGDIREESVGYTMKYLDKVKSIPAHRNDDREPQFGLMSKGLGANYITDNIVDYHKADLLNRMYCTTKDGKKISMPRYYKNKIYTEPERDAINEHQAVEIPKREQAKRDAYVGDYDRDMQENAFAKFEKQKKAAAKRDKL